MKQLSPFLIFFFRMNRFVTYRSEYRNTYTTSRDDPEYSGRKKPKLNGPFHLISDRNFQNLWHDSKHPRPRSLYLPLLALFSYKQLKFQCVNVLPKRKLLMLKASLTLSRINLKTQLFLIRIGLPSTLKRRFRCLKTELFENALRPVAMAFGRVFVLTGIFYLRGVIKYERRRCEPLRGSGGMPPQKVLKSRDPEMLFSALCASIFQTRWSVK